MARVRAADLLGPNGPFARAMDAYEDRPGQVQMAQAVEDALANGRVLLCEAGTGTGKTLAYLIPALLSGLKVVVSTATKTLQDQIFTKDLPLVAEHLGFEPEVALVKGLGNYLCKRRFNELRGSGLAAGSMFRSLPLVEAWAAETETGDMAELASLPEGDPLWREICSSSETRIGSNCAYHGECFVTKMRKEAEEARLLIVNHHLFFADLALRAASGDRGFAGGALPPYDAVILDEAHQIEDVATQFFGVSLSKARVESMLRDAERAFMAAGLGDPVFHGGEGFALTAIVREASTLFFEAIAAVARAAGGDMGGRALLGSDAWTEDVAASWGRFDETLEALAGYAKANARDEPMRLVAARAAALRTSASKILDPAADQVAWSEITSRNVSLGASPIDLGSTLRQFLFDRAYSVVLTSATLATAPRIVRAETESSFSFVRSRLGLNEAIQSPVHEAIVSSPFDYQKSALFYVPRDLPEPNDPDFVDLAAERAAELVHLTSGGAFILCTSVRSMRALARRVSTLIKKPILMQGDGPKGALLSKFRSQNDGVLVATMSFWEGVDVPGDALRLVVIDKVPFAVPSDPVVAARAKSLEHAGKNPFVDYFVPQAAITLKQGFGRLIRSQKDQGIVALLDRRARTKSYGRSLLESLPPARRIDALDDLRDAWLALRRS
ncbi:MAG: ATP-dependent DNA helicase [Polyangiaceae bacterium]|nr:ATP-dependent DNA helicase [Polyangiaceae bacterium]